MIPNKEKLEEIIIELQKIMRIQDWDIELQLITGLEMAKDQDGELNVDGIAFRDLRSYKATIKINTETTIDWYGVLVHEMLHIQSTELIYSVGLLKKGNGENITTLYEGLTEKQAKMFCNIYPVTNFIKEGEL